MGCSPSEVSGELEGARVRDPQCREGQQRGGRDRGRAVVEHAEPRAELAQLPSTIRFRWCTGPELRVLRSTRPKDYERKRCRVAREPGAPAPGVQFEAAMTQRSTGGVPWRTDPARLDIPVLSGCGVYIEGPVLVMLIGVCVSIVAEPAAEPARYDCRELLRRLARPGTILPGAASMDVEIQASLPKLKKTGTVARPAGASSARGRITYEMLRFEGDGTVQKPGDRALPDGRSRGSEGPGFRRWP